ncbi:phosphate propanoyltransferase [Calidifontibacillus erzurumensis]|uniref:phosphate propanoyltransferase n=1 Tax=Calidifontibacillus erzurumensis TaxID=2741433 RepID=UPI0035B535A7
MNEINRTVLLEQIRKAVFEELQKQQLITTNDWNNKFVPISVSARHIHLEQEHVDILFGKGYQLTKYKDISQPGQYACKETVTIKGPRGAIENVRVLYPIRKQTQVEVAESDARRLGIHPPVRESGDLKGSAPITVIGPKGVVNLEEGCIIADRHIHMTPEDAKRFGVMNGQKVSVEISGPKGGIMHNVTIRVKDTYALDMHIDVDDANAFGLKGNAFGKIIP